MNCPICRKVELEGQQIICSKCKEDSPYNLLSGYSPVKKISDELKKVGLYKKKIRQLTVGLIATGILLVIAILFSIVGIVSSEELGGNENVVEEAGFHTPDPVLPEVNEPIVDSSLSKELAKLKEENSQLKRDIEELGQKYSLEKKEWEQEKMALSTVFNSYFGQGFSSIVMQEIRESKGLAYSVSAGYLPSSKKTDYDRTYVYIGTQANKVPEAVEAMLNLLNDMPESEQQFITAKESALKQIASQRITKSSIFWNYESLQKRGLDYDNREEIYNEIKKMTMADVSAFFENNIKGQDYSVSVIGNKNDMNMKALEKLGEVHVMDVDYLFNYQTTEVKQ